MSCTGRAQHGCSTAALHFTNLAHGLGVAAIRSERPELPVGIVINAHSVYPGSNSAEDKAAAERAFDFHNGVFFDPIFKGEYPEDFLSALGERMPAIEDGDMATIAQPLDWWGLNYYTPMRVSADPAKGAEYPATVNAKPVSNVKTDIGWEVYAPALGSLVETLNARYRLPDCYITENGACYNMGVENGTVDDQPRLDYISDHLAVTADLIAKGYPMRGYFAWSLMVTSNGPRAIGCASASFTSITRHRSARSRKAVAGIRTWRNGFQAATTSRDDAGASGRRFCTKKSRLLRRALGLRKNVPVKGRARAP